MNEYGFAQGIARNASESEYPELWRGLQFHSDPRCGATGTSLVDFANHDTGSLLNGPLWVASARGTAISLDGSNDYISIPFSTAFNFSGPFSFAIWIRYSTTPSNAGIVYKGSLASSQGDWALSISSPSIVFRVNNASGSDVSATAPSTGAWHQIVCTYDGANRMMYIDSKPAATVATTGAINNTGSNGLYLGTYFSSSFVFGGQIGAFSAYSRPLTQANISQLFAGASPLVRKQERAVYHIVSGGAPAIFRNRTGSRARFPLAA